MRDFLSYLFWPNPGGWSYGTLSAQMMLGYGLLLLVASVILSRWRHTVRNPRTKLLSRSWASAALWFGVVALVLALSRIEYIQFFAMRFLWVVYALALVLYVVFQVINFRRRHYTVMQTPKVIDEREKYLPRSR